MALPENVIAQLEAILEELESLADRCNRGLLLRKEVEDAIARADGGVRGMLQPDSDAFRMYDRQVLQRTEWWEEDVGTYAPASDCEKLRHRRGVLRDVLDSEEAEFLRAERRPRGQWYFSEGQRLPAMRRVFGIMRLARTSLGVVDTYLDESIFDYLEVLDRGIAIRLLTRQRGFPVRLGQAFNAQRGNFEARECRDCHDRFLVIDDATAYHLGASINHIGERACMIHRVDDPAERDRFLADYRTWWDRGNPLT